MGVRVSGGISREWRSLHEADEIANGGMRETPGTPKAWERSKNPKNNCSNGVPFLSDKPPYGTCALRGNRQCSSLMDTGVSSINDSQPMRPFLLLPAVISLTSFVLLYGKFLGLGSGASQVLCLVGLFLPVAVIPCSIVGSYLEVKRVGKGFHPAFFALVIHLAGIASAGCFIYAWYVLFRDGF